MSGQRRRRWTNIDPPLVQRTVLTGYQSHNEISDQRWLSVWNIGPALKQGNLDHQCHFGWMPLFVPHTYMYGQKCITLLCFSDMVQLYVRMRRLFCRYRKAVCASSSWQQGLTQGGRQSVSDLGGSEPCVGRCICVCAYATTLVVIKKLYVRMRRPWSLSKNCMCVCGDPLSLSKSCMCVCGDPLSL